MDLIGSAKSISDFVFNEYENLFLEYQRTGIIGSFKKIEDVLYLENKFYSMLKDFQLDWIRETLITKKLASVAPFF